MPRVGIRELKNETSEILRAVREEKAEYVVTHRGKPVAVILPLADDWQEDESVRAAAAARANADFWARWERESQAVTEMWQSDRSAVELIDEQRR